MVRRTSLGSPTTSLVVFGSLLLCFLGAYLSCCVAGFEAFAYASTVIPIERAVPAMILAAASTSLAFRSAILVS
ncbi:hypothetical protein GM51_21160, partial [freshwater metagenome]